MFIESLSPPVLLIAMPQVSDPFFNRSVVLLLEHSPDGSFGIVVNRPLDLKVQAALGGSNMEWHGDAEAVVYLGGPVQPNTGLTIFSAGPDDHRTSNAATIAPGLYLAQDTDTLRALAAEPPAQFRLLIGYAGWTGGQLEDELTRNDWLLAAFDMDLIFARDASDVWRRAVESIGVRPEALPSWAMPGEDDRGN